MISTVFTILSLILLAYGALCMLMSRQFKKGMESVPKEDYSFYPLLPIGLYTEKLLIRFCMVKPGQISSVDVKRKLIQLYGEANLRHFVSVYIANDISGIYVCLLAGCLLVAGTGSLDMLVMMLVLIAALHFVALPKKLDTLLRERQQAIALEFPDFMSKVVLLLGTGMTAQKAWLTAGQDGRADSPLYQEIALVNREVASMNRPFSDALLSFSVRCRNPNISRFVSTINLAVENGADGLEDTLNQQADEAWKTRRQTALTKGEEANTKLNLSLFMMFGSVLIIIMAPAVMAMNSFF